MTPREITLVTESWVKLLPFSATALELFYHKLTKANPEFHNMHLQNMRAQDNKLISLLDTAIKCLSRPDMLLPVLHKMGKRHLRYNLKPEHYPIIKQTFISTLEDMLGESFTPEIHEAWLSVCNTVTDVMSTIYPQHNVA